MLIGEAPGAKEDETGIPFVGRSGKLLNILLENEGFDYEKDVFICNLLKSRPPNNRTPTRQEIQNHIPWLYQQIKLVDPLIIVLIGSSALRAILGIKSKISDLRGTWHNWNGIYAMPIFHPSYLLRNPSKTIGGPYNLTCLDLREVNRKLVELQFVPKTTSFKIPMSH
ncbi:Uracil-DNA glycosylase [Prochlorococcus marinus str. SS51]|nr:Uracil-DNA glycosylase [Prochlorococcus marinus str. SS51]